MALTRLRNAAPIQSARDQQLLTDGAPPMATFKSIRVVGMIGLAIIPAAFAALQLAIAQQEQQQPQTPQPTEEHRLLHKDVGTWDAEISMFSPVEGGAPMKSKGSEKAELLPGGMWLISRFEGEMMGMPFSGIGTNGYDPIEKKYVGTWIDSMSPYMMTIKGDYDAATKTMTSTGEGRDMTTREMFTAKLVTRYIDDNTRTFEMHMPGEDGGHWKVLEIKYTRRAQ
jgi:hypothetical protein